ncbi:hypothetical protein [uncultured Rikenella sp.]|uniref:hypothetical protein n=1 Tax=uncultured Rikenella sp. TaxID=368003 RepID=UPI00261947E7|nr:hypothetical protein [uncultured Rikenella sp.]
MKTHRDSLLAKLHILLKEQGVDEATKRAMYAGYGVETAADLTAPQLRHLVGTLAGEAVPEAAPRPVSNETRRLRSQCLALMTKSPDPANIKLRGLGLPNDWAVINPFVRHHTGALLNQLSDGRLIDFVKKLRKIRDSGWFYNAPRPDENRPAHTLVFVATPTGDSAIN